MKKKTASIQFLILRLIIQCALLSRKYGMWYVAHKALSQC